MKRRIARFTRDMRAENVVVTDQWGTQLHLNLSADTIAWLDRDDFRKGDVLKVPSTGETVIVEQRYRGGVYRVRRGAGCAMPQFTDACAEAIWLDEPRGVLE